MSSRRPLLAASAAPALTQQNREQLAKAAQKLQPFVNYNLPQGLVSHIIPDHYGQLVYGFRSGIRVAVNGTYYTGGRTTINGVEKDDLQSNTRVGLTVALPVNRHNSVKLFASTGSLARTCSSGTHVHVNRAD